MSWGTGVREASEVSAWAVCHATVPDEVVPDQGAVAGEEDVAANVSDCLSIMVITPCAHDSGEVHHIPLARSTSHRVSHLGDYWYCVVQLRVRPRRPGALLCIRDRRLRREPRLESRPRPFATVIANQGRGGTAWFYEVEAGSHFGASRASNPACCPGSLFPQRPRSTSAVAPPAWSVRRPLVDGQ